MKNKVKKVNKKAIILAAMVMLLGGAVYVNWQLTGGDMGITQLLTGKKSLGDAQLVNNPVVASGDAEVDAQFVQMRLDRQKTRDDSINVLKSVTEQTDLTDDEKKSAVDALAQTAKDMEKETVIENLIKAKGFTDCMAYISDNSVTVTVKCDETLTRSQSGQISDIVTGETGMPAENIKIIEVK